VVQLFLKSATWPVSQAENGEVPGSPSYASALRAFSSAASMFSTLLAYENRT
jgi:hypothetical protein